jgi:hypothetical protein
MRAVLTVAVAVPGPLLVAALVTYDQVNQRIADWGSRFARGASATDSRVIPFLVLLACAARRPRCRQRITQSRRNHA